MRARRWSLQGMAERRGSLLGLFEHEAHRLAETLQTVHPIDLVCFILFPITFAVATTAIFQGRG